MAAVQNKIRACGTSFVVPFCTAGILPASFLVFVFR